MGEQGSNRFTERALKVLALAQEEARRFNHNYIGTEHILLGIVREGDGVAARVLADLGIELPKVRDAIEFIIGRGERQVPGEIGFTPRAKKVIELAIDEARRLGHHYVGTEHLLLGLIREGEGIAAGVMESLGVSLKKAREQVIEVLTLRSLGASPPSTDLMPPFPFPRPPVERPRWKYLALEVIVENGVRVVKSLSGELDNLPLTGVNAVSLRDALDALGRDGWELAGIDLGVDLETGESRGPSLYIFKRQSSG